MISTKFGENERPRQAPIVASWHPPLGASGSSMRVLPWQLAQIARRGSLLIVLALFAWAKFPWQVAAPLLLLFAIICFSTKREPSPAEQRLRRLQEQADDPPCSPQNVVLLSLFRHGIRIGGDFGQVVFVEGWLLFEGERVSFSLKPCDIDEEASNHANSLLRSGLTARTAAVVISQTPVAGLEVRLCPTPRVQSAEFHWNLYRWRNGDNPTGMSVLPPSSPRGTWFLLTKNAYLIVARALRKTILVGALICLLPFLQMYAGPNPWFIAAAMFGLFLLYESEKIWQTR